MVDYIRDLRLAKWGSGIKLHSSNSEPPMSALGQKQTLRHLQTMSALPPKADIHPVRTANHYCRYCRIFANSWRGLNGFGT